MASVDELTAACVARLKGRINGCQIEAYPDDPKSYNFIHPTAALLVRYAGSRYPENGIQSTDSLVVQDRYPNLEVSILTRRLTGPAGAGAFLDAVRTVLTGWKPPDCGRCYLAEEDFDRYDSKNITWQHHISFEALGTLIETPEEDHGPLLKRLSCIGSDNQQTEVP